MSIQYSLVIFTALTGIAGLLFSAVAVNEFAAKTKKTDFVASIVALVLLAAGGCVSVTHLSHPDRILGALNHPTVGIFTEALLVGLVALCIIIYLVMYKRENKAKKFVALIGAILGIALSFMAGYSYIMESIPAWNTILLPITYFTTVIAGGFGLYALIATLKKEENLGVFGLIIMIGGILAAITAGIFLQGVGVGAGLTWGVCVLLGGIIPAVAGWLIFKGKANPVAMAAVVFIGAFIGCFVFRCLMWVSGTTLYNLFGLVI